MIRRKWLLTAASSCACLVASSALAAPKPAAKPPAAGENDVAEVVVTGRFIDTGAFSGTKLNIPVADTPMSVQ